MVNQVVPRAELENVHAGAGARDRVAADHGPEAGEAVGQPGAGRAGLWTALQAAMSAGTSSAMRTTAQVHGMLIDPSGVATIRRGSKAEE